MYPLRLLFVRLLPRESNHRELSQMVVQHTLLDVDGKDLRSARS